MSGFDLGSILAVMSSRPPAKLSFKRPQSPLGSAAEMAIPAIVMLSNRSFHSSGVKFDLSAMSDTPLVGLLLQARIALRSRCVERYGVTSPLGALPLDPPAVISAPA